MAWNHNARNRSAEVRRVNYHEDGTNKGRSSSSGGRKNNNQEPNKLFNAFCGGLLLFALGSWGLGALGDAITSIGDGVSQAKEVVDTVNDIKDIKSESSSKSKQTKAKHESSIDYEIEISAEDVRDILEQLEIGGDEDVNYNETQTVFVEYSAFNSEVDYRKAIVDRLYEFNESVTFIATNHKEMEYEDNKVEYNRVLEVIQSIEVRSPQFTSIEIGGMPSCYEENKLTVAITFQ